MRNTKKGPKDVVDTSWAAGKFFFVLYFVFLLLTNVLGTSYLQGQQKEEEHGNTAPTRNGNSKGQ
jgi:hypothetical protein